jgi:hypothetical protein
MYGMKKQLGNIGHTAHFGGASAGFLVTLFIYPELILQQPIMVGVLLLPILLMANVFRKKG